MPTEELFGAYNLQVEAADNKSADSFDFQAIGDETEAAMLLPAVQAAREAARQSETEEPVDGFQIADAPTEPMVIGLLLPAVQKSTTEPAGTLHHETWDGQQAVADDHKEWIDILTISPPISRAVEDVVKNAGLRSDGELVQAVSDAEISSDFIF